jgi:phi13 family phage major tail protein
MSKLALKGFRAARLWPITTNDDTTFATGTMIALSGAQNLAKDVSRSDYTIYADDGVYASGSDFQYEDLTITLAELPLEVESKLSGGTYNATDKTYLFKNTDAAPEFAFAYAAATIEGQYRMFKHYVVKLISVKVEHKTKGDDNDIQAYELTLRATQRQADGAVRITKDSEDGTYDWINTIDQLPVAGG